jgi:hypothetical protein
MLPREAVLPWLTAAGRWLEVKSKFKASQEDAGKVERPSGVTGDGGAASGASSVGRDVRVGGCGLLYFLGLRRAPAPH